MKYHENLHTNAHAWLVEQVQAGKTDSSLAQRFHLWLRQQTGDGLTPTDTLAFFLICCAGENIRAAIVDDRFTFGIYPDGIAPQPEYKGPDYG